MCKRVGYQEKQSQFARLWRENRGTKLETNSDGVRGQWEMASVLGFSGGFWDFSLDMRADICYDKIGLHEATSKTKIVQSSWLCVEEKKIRKELYHA
jgi:hypothetical protein